MSNYIGAVEYLTWLEARQAWNWMFHAKNDSKDIDKADFINRLDETWVLIV